MSINYEFNVSINCEFNKEKLNKFLEQENITIDEFIEVSRKNIEVDLYDELSQEDAYTVDIEVTAKKK